MTPAAADVRATALSLFALLLLVGMPVGASVAEERDGDEAPEERTAENTPSLALLDYLGRWDEADAGWLELLAHEHSGATAGADADNGDDDHE